MRDRHRGKVSLLLLCDGAPGSTLFPEENGAYFSPLYGAPVIAALSPNLSGSLDLRTTPESDPCAISGSCPDIGLVNDSVATIDTWIYATSASGGCLVDNQSDSTHAPNWRIVVTPTAVEFWVGNSNTTDVELAASKALALASKLNEWIHIRVVKSGTVCTVFVNGAKGTPTAFSVTMGRRTDRFLNVGTAFESASGSHFIGYVGGVRLTRDVARSDYPFNPLLEGAWPTLGPLATVDPAWGQVTALLRPEGAIGSSTFQLEGGTPLTKKSSPVAVVGRFRTAVRMGFNGHLHTTVKPLVLAGDNKDLTLDFWFRPQSWSTTTGRMFGAELLPLRIGAEANTGFMEFFVETAGTSWGWMSGISPVPITDTAWHHFAVTRAGSVWRLWLDGEQIATKTEVVDVSQTGDMIIGANGGAGVGGASPNSSGQWDVEDLRVTVGTARFNNAFYPVRQSAGQGAGKILAGRVYEEGIPATRVVRTYDRQSLQLLVESISGPDGEYLHRLDAGVQECFTIVLDADAFPSYLSLIADKQRPVQLLT